MPLEPYLFFEGRCEEALTFYGKALGAETVALLRFKESPDPAMVPPGGELAQIPGSTPSLLRLPPGCAFRARCDRASARCATMPELSPHTAEHDVRCHHPVGAGQRVEVLA